MARKQVDAKSSTGRPRGRPRKRKDVEEDQVVQQTQPSMQKRAKVTSKAHAVAVNTMQPSRNGHEPAPTKAPRGSAAASSKVKQPARNQPDPPKKRRGRPPKVKPSEPEPQEDEGDKQQVMEAQPAQGNGEGMRASGEKEEEEEEVPEPPKRRGRPPKNATKAKSKTKSKTTKEVAKKTTKSNAKVTVKTKTTVRGKSKVKSKTSATSKAVSSKKTAKSKPAKAKVDSKTKVAVKAKSKAELRLEKLEQRVTRKRRIMARRKVENACMEKPFYTEDGSEWNSTNVDFNDLATLRTMWELPAACHILWLLQQPLKLRVSNTLLEYEAALLNPESSPLLEDVFTKLLLSKPERDQLTAGIGLKYPWWNKQLKNYYIDMYSKWYALLRKAGETPDDDSDDDESEPDSLFDAGSFLDEDAKNETESPGTSATGESFATPLPHEQIDVELTDDEWITLDILKSRLECLGTKCPLKHKSFADLSIDLRCKILLNLCEAVVEDPANMEYLRGMEEDDLRVEPVGRDRLGNLFYYFPQFFEERRIYRVQLLTNEDQEAEEQAAMLRASTKRQSFDLTWKQHGPTVKWDLWAKGDEALRGMFEAMKSIKGRKLRGEQDLLDHLEVILEQVDDEAAEKAKQMEKANRKAILEAIPRKRSLRLQVKQLEQMEAQRKERESRGELNEHDKSMMSAEELAELKRNELLKKMEKEAELEARRLEEERRQKEAAILDRELRFQRRAEHDKLVQEQAAQREARLEAIKRKRAADRERRALLRKQRQENHQGASGNESSASTTDYGGTSAVSTPEVDSFVENDSLVEHTDHPVLKPNHVSHFANGHPEIRLAPPEATEAAAPCPAGGVDGDGDIVMHRDTSSHKEISPSPMDVSN